MFSIVITKSSNIILHLTLLFFAVYPKDDEEDIFQCGKCKKQFTSLQLFISHKQSPCLTHQPPLPQTIQPQQATLTLAPTAGMFAPALNISRSFTQTQVNGVVPSVSSNLLSSNPLICFYTICPVHQIVFFKLIKNYSKLPPQNIKQNDWKPTKLLSALRKWNALGIPCEHFRSVKNFSKVW